MSTRINRTGTINFGDASISIWEEGISQARNEGGYAGETAWTRQFKRDIFGRIVQTLNRLGWSVRESTYIFTGNDNRYCTKGDLQADLRLSGRCIVFEMFQSVNAPDRPDHGGRYQSDKAGHMPYVMRLEMERTRRRIRDYLCNVFTGYAFNTKGSDGRNAKRGPMHLSALEWIAESYRTSWHFKGDWDAYLAANSNPSMVGCFNRNRKSGDGALLKHGQTVWCFDYRGRIQQGIAYYNINNMWWVALGRYDVTNKAGFELYTTCPANPRVKRNADRRRKRLEAELATAVKAMKFERAAQLRDILFPRDQELFNVWHDDHQLYHRAGFSGYTADQSQAGKFTAEEVRGWDRAPNTVVPFAMLEAA